jgi:hypothetical protein
MATFDRSITLFDGMGTFLKYMSDSEKVDKLIAKADEKLTTDLAQQRQHMNAKHDQEMQLLAEQAAELGLDINQLKVEP